MSVLFFLNKYHKDYNSFRWRDGICIEHSSRASKEGFCRWHVQLGTWNAGMSLRVVDILHSRGQHSMSGLSPKSFLITRLRIQSSCPAHTPTPHQNTPQRQITKYFEYISSQHNGLQVFLFHPCFGPQFSYLPALIKSCITPLLQWTIVLIAAKEQRSKGSIHW